jgi:GMP synthase-like glutamine amidotransferase
MMSEVLIIQHQAGEGPGTIEEELLGAGHNVRKVRVDEGDMVPREVGSLSGLVVMGGSMGVGDQGKLTHLKDEIALLKQFLVAEKPILGVCLGAQLLASALGAEVVAGEKEIGWMPVRKMPDAFKDAVLRRLPENFPALLWHGDHFALPKGAAHLLSTDKCGCAGFRYGKKAYGLVPHLEMTAAMVDEMVAGSRKELVAAGVEAAQILEDTSENVEPAEELARVMWRGWAGLLV